MGFLPNPPKKGWPWTPTAFGPRPALTDHPPKRRQGRPRNLRKIVREPRAQAAGAGLCPLELRIYPLRLRVAGGCAVFDGEPEAGAVAAQIEVGVAPGMQLGGAA